MLQAGFGRADITPPPGSEMPGGMTSRKAKGTHDPLWAEAFVATNGDAGLALVGIDGLFVERSSVRRARSAIAFATKIPAESVLVGASHTHSGGPVATCFNSEEDPAYLEQLGDGIAAAVRDAWGSLHAAELGVATGSVTGIQFNRRFLMRAGREVTHPGKMNPAIVRPAGPIDPDLGVLATRDPSGELAGLVVNFACHNTVVGGEEYSADYVYHLRQHLRRIYREDLPVVFLLGACGDITQVDNLRPGRESGHAWGDLMGRTLAAEAARTVGRMVWLKEAELAAAVETVPVAIRGEPDVDRERPALGLGAGDAAEKIYAAERRRVAAERQAHPMIDAEVQALRIGPLGIATNGAEYFCQFALDIKACARFRPTWFVSLANEYIGYVPTATAFYAGGYEPRTAQSSKLAPDAGQKLAEGAVRALGRLA